jgi:hypothetical protein
MSETGPKPAIVEADGRADQRAKKARTKPKEKWVFASHERDLKKLNRLRGDEKKIAKLYRGRRYDGSS